MKKFILATVLIMLGTAAYAQKDTTLISSLNVRFDTEKVISKTGNEKVNYIVNYNNVWYVTDKTSYTRYKTAIRFGLIPNVALVSDEKTKAKKIIVL